MKKVKEITSWSVPGRNSFSWILRSLFLTVLISLAGCASNIPLEIRQAPAGNPVFQEVHTNIEQFTGARVRWGGIITRVENNPGETRIEIVARDLTESGRPRTIDASPGRFIAVIPGFLDPAIFAKDREITINGVVIDSIHHPIGQFDYNYPVINVNHYQLWSPLPKRRHYHSPFWYGPGFHPYPWHDPYPYRYPYRHYY